MPKWTVRSDAPAARTGHRVRVIALTASAMDDERAACFAVGMDDFLSKPLTPRLCATPCSARGPTRSRLAHFSCASRIALNSLPGDQAG